nr:MFS transporter [Halomarina sp. BND7]
MNHNDRAITGLVMLAHSMVHTYEFAFPVLITVWLVQFDTTSAVIGGIVGVGLALFGLGALPAGVLTDRIGSQPLIVASLVGMGGAFLLLSVAPSLPVVALALVVWGASASVYHPAGLSLITRGVEERGTAFAYHGTAGNVGTALGPFLTTVLLFLLGDDWHLVVALLALPALAGALFALRADVNETAAIAADGGTSKANPGVDSFAEFVATSRRLFVGAFVLVFAAVMLSGIYYRGILTFLPELLGGFDVIRPMELFGREFTPANYIYTFLLGVGVLGQYAGGKLTDRVPLELGLAVGYGTLGLVALAYLPVAAVGVLPLLALSAVLGFFLFLVQPFYQATVAEYTPSEARGLSYGYTYLGVFGVGALGAPIAGTALQYLSADLLFVILAAFAFGASAIGLSLLRLSRRR